MQTEKIEVDRAEALRLYREYRKHQHYSDPIDDEIRRTYQHLSKGKVVIRAIESIRMAGLDDQHLPKLALAPATAKACHALRRRDGSLILSPADDFWHERKHQVRFGEETFVFPRDSFPAQPAWASSAPGERMRESKHRAMMPIIPVHLRPRRGLENYHILWEAEWERIPPRDPYLLRRIGKADLWLVVAAWDLTEVERAALATRVLAS